MQPQQVQCTRRLGVADHEHEVQPLERRAVAQRAGQRVALAQQHDVALLQDGQAFGARQSRQVAEGQVQPAVLERRRDGIGRQLHRLDAHARRLAADDGHQRRQEFVGADVAHVHDEAALRMRGVEGLGLVQRHVELAQGRLHLARQLVGLGRRLHATRAAREQRVAQRQPQPGERMAHRRLAEAQRLGGTADAARRVHGREDMQQVEVEVADIHAVHRTHQAHGMDEWRQRP